jgi:hypothetical protein
MNIVGRVSSLLLVAVSGLVLAGTARAEAGARETTTPAMPPVRLVLAPVPSGVGPGLALDRLRERLEAELRRPVSVDERATADADILTVIYLPARQELSICYLPRGGRLVIRTVRAPGTTDEVAALAVLLAGNVARDQTSELLGQPPVPPRPPAAPAPVAAASGAPEAEPVLTQVEKPGLLDRIQRKTLLWSGNLTLMNVGVSFSDGYGYGLVAMAVHVENGARMLGPGLALGARIPLRQIAFQSDVGLSFLYGLDPHLVPGSMFGYTNDRLITRVRSAVAYSVFPGFELFAGVAVALTTHLYHAPDSEWGQEVFGGFAL